DPVQQVAVGQVTVVEDPAGGELDPAGLQVVEDHRLDAVVQAGGGDRAADVSGAAGDEDLHTAPPAGRPVRETVSARSMVREPSPPPQVTERTSRGRPDGRRADGRGVTAAVVVSTQQSWYPPNRRSRYPRATGPRPASGGPHPASGIRPAGSGVATGTVVPPESIDPRRCE